MFGEGSAPFGTQDVSQSQQLRGQESDSRDPSDTPSARDQRAAAFLALDPSLDRHSSNTRVGPAQGVPGQDGVLGTTSSRDGSQSIAANKKPLRLLMPQPLPETAKSPPPELTNPHKRKRFEAGRKAEVNAMRQRGACIRCQIFKEPASIPLMQEASSSS